jgi:CHAT domain-containing protein/tetratricopeptide (TPR) repeat protein
MGATDRSGESTEVIRRAAAAATLAAAAFLSLFGGSARADVAGDLAVARTQQTLSQWAASESLATAVLGRLEADFGADSLRMADALSLIAGARRHLDSYTDDSGFEAAMRCLGIRERRLGADHPDVATAHIEIARWLHGRDRSGNAVDHARRAVDIRTAKLAPNDTLTADAWDQLAVIQRDRGEFRAALDAWTRAIEIRERVHGEEHPEVARLLAQTGVPWMELGDLNRAREVLEQSLAIFSRTTGPDAFDRWIPLNILSDVESRAGNIERGLDLLQEALRIVTKDRGADSRQALTLRFNLAVALENFGDSEGALAILKPLLPIMESQYGASHPRTISVLQGFAYAYSRIGDTERAMRSFQDIDSRLAQRQDPPPMLMAEVRAMEAELLYRSHRDREAREMCERLIRSQWASGKPWADAVSDANEVLIFALESLGDTTALDSARRDVIRIRETYPLDPHRVAVRNPYTLAHSARWLGRRGEALQYALEAERNQFDSMRLNLLAAPDRRGLQLSSLHGFYLDMVVELCGAADSALVETAWDRLIRSRGLVRATLARRRLPRGLEPDTAVAGTLARWKEAQGAWARRLVGSGAGGDSAARSITQRVRASAEEAESAYARMLASRHASLAAEAIGLAEVRSRLRPGQALVAFYELRGSKSGWGRDDTSHVVAFVARGGSGACERVALGPTAALWTAIGAWKRSLAAPPSEVARAADRVEQESRRLGRDVRVLTWDVVAPRVANATDVFIVADGPLFDLPWQALPVGADHYLVESGPRFHMLNAERELAEPVPASNSESMLAVGAPDFTNVGGDRGEAPLFAVARSAAGPCAGGLPTFVPLPAAAAEVEAVARSWRTDLSHHATVLIGAEATEAAFKRDVRGQAIIHLATHGVVATDTCASGAIRMRGVGEIGPIGAPADRKAKSTPAEAANPEAAVPSPWMPRRVWLAFAGASRAGEQGNENEGLLTAEEVVTLDLTGTDWVVLSACHSGFADAWSREGVLGMRRAFELAGARSVIASQWAVEDEATSEWMQALYTARAHGAVAASEAVESADRSVLAARRAAHRSTHPFFWAAFMATGE